MGERRSSFGSIYRKKRAKGAGFYPGWFCRWTDGDGRRREKWAGHTEADAEAFRAGRLVEKYEQRATGRRPIAPASLQELRPTIAAMMAARYRPATMKVRTSQLRILAEALGPRPLCDLERADVAALLRRLSRERGLGPGSQKAYRECLSVVFQCAQDLGAAKDNPTKGVRLPGTTERPVPYVGPDELRRLYAAVRPESRAHVILLAETGLRRNELWKLTWDDVEPGLRSLTAESKTGRPRMVPLTARAADELRKLFAARPPRALGQPALVCPSPHATSVARDLARACERAGLPHLRLHDLRHAFASGLVRAGVPIPDVARLLGHANVQTTMRYAVWAPEDAATQAIRALERSRGQNTDSRASTTSAHRK